MTHPTRKGRRAFVLHCGVGAASGALFDSPDVRCDVVDSKNWVVENLAQAEGMGVKRKGGMLSDNPEISQGGQEPDFPGGPSLSRKTPHPRALSCENSAIRRPPPNLPLVRGRDSDPARRLIFIPARVGRRPMSTATERGRDRQCATASPCQGLSIFGSVPPFPGERRRGG